MDSFLLNGVLDLPWWAAVAWVLASTHLTIVAVTLYLHRHQCHHSIDLHPAVSHVLRCWLWLTTGMVTREWVAVHRKHHAKVDTAADPHSPQHLGLNRVLWGGVLLYVDESKQDDTLRRYGYGTPNDWVERSIYSRFVVVGLIMLGAAEIVLLGAIGGGLVFLVQIAWIPFWAAGVINGVGHYWGYRNWSTPDASTNIVPLGMLIGGEELHNNHHAFPTSAKLSSKWFEFDIGWLYIRCLAALGLATVRHLAPVPRLAAERPHVDLRTLQAVIRHRYDVMAQYRRCLAGLCAEERDSLQRSSLLDRGALNEFEAWVQSDPVRLTTAERVKLGAILAKSLRLRMAHAMRADLPPLWERSMATREDLVGRLQDWCRRADASGIACLVGFSRRLRSYAP